LTDTAGVTVGSGGGRFGNGCGTTGRRRKSRPMAAFSN
jgi:hypothetical protein